MLALLLLGQTLRPDLDAILDDPKLAGAVVSCQVAEMDGTVLYERNPALRVMPASNEKLLTCAFALWKLGPEYQPETRIWKRRDRTVVDAPGDPMMTHERLIAAARALHLDPKLPIYVHQAYRPLIGPGWEWDDLPNKYAAPVCAFSVDRGSFELWGGAGKLQLRPFNYGIAPRWGKKTGPRKVNYDPIRRRLTFDGALPASMTRLDTLALAEPDVCATEFLGARMIPLDQAPKSPPSLTMGGIPLKDQMKECLVKSDNNIAENLLLMAGARDPAKPYETATASLTQFLEQTVGIAPGDVRPSDGSGMSRHNLATARAFVLLLRWAANQPTRDVWMDGLARPGAGTLASRLEGIPFVGKTGTLDSVVALSGIVQADHPVVVSLIFNHFVAKTSEVRDLADRFFRRVASGTKSAPAWRYEARSPVARFDAPDDRRDRRSRRDGVDARARAHRRAQSGDALLHRP